MEYNLNHFSSFVNEPEAPFATEKIGPYVDLLNDLGFKHVFGRDANKEILMAFLNEIIKDREIIDLEHINNEQIPFDMENKKSVFDLYCKTQDGSRIVVELQNKGQRDFVDRTIYYSGFPVQSQVEKGNTKYTFSAVYVISILNFNLKELSGATDVVSYCRLQEINSNITISKKYTFIFIELPKFTKNLEEISPNGIQDGFFYCFKNMKHLEEQPQELEHKIWDQLFNAALYARMNEQEKLAYIKDMNTARDIRNQIEYAREEGIEEGMEKSKAAIAKSMKVDGMDLQIISKYTGLSVEEIEKL